MERNTKITVVIPTYGRTDSLGICLRSLCAQTMTDRLEVIVIDQNAEGFLEKHIDHDLLSWCRIEKIDFANVSSARNLGGQLAQNGIILFLDDDLEADPLFCENGLKRLSRWPDIDCLVPVVTNDSGSRDNLILRPGTENHSQVMDVIPVSNAMSAAFFIRKKVFENVGGFDPVLFDLVRSTEDKDFFSRLTAAGFGLYLDKDLEIFHREEISGGCALREKDYWENRTNFIRGWIYMGYKRNDWRSLHISDWWSIIRSAFLNRQGLKSGPSFIVRNIRLILEGHRFVRANLERIIFAHSRSAFR